MERSDIESGLKYEYIYPTIPSPASQKQQPIAIQSNLTSTKNLKDYLGWSIFNTFCCCFCLGIAAFVFSIKTRTAQLNEPNLNQAQRSSRLSFKLNLAATISGVIILLMVFSLMVAFYYLIKDINFC